MRAEHCPPITCDLRGQIRPDYIHLLLDVPPKMSPNKVRRSVPGTFRVNLGFEMPRPNRSLKEGRVYRVYNRVGGDDSPFVYETLAARFVQLFRLVVERDQLIRIGAWLLYL